LATICSQQQVKQLLHISTAVVAGKTAATIVTEETICEPVNDYEKTKLAIEQELIDSLNTKIPLVILRPTAVFGEGGKNLVKLIADLQQDSAFIKWLKLSLYHNRKLNLVAVENVIAAIFFVMQIPTHSPVEYFIISDDEFEQNNYNTIVNIASQISNQSQSKPLPLINHVLPFLLKWRQRSQANPKRIYSSEKLTSRGFCKPVLFEDSARAYIAALCAKLGLE
jgi:nucleoside-diphosphate-sugar epimerase